MHTYGDAIFLGRGVVAFQEDSRQGIEDMMEVDEFKFSESVEKVEKFTYRTAQVKKIASIIKQTTVSGSFVCSAPRLEVLRFFALADSVSEQTQAAGTLEDEQFTAYLKKWINLGKTNISNVKVLKAGLAVTVSDTTDTFTATNHGFQDDDIVEFTADTLPNPINADTSYYVVSATTNDFKVSTTKGGTPVDITSVGTNVKAHFVYTEDTDYELSKTQGLLYSLTIPDSTGILVSLDYAEQKTQSLQGVTKNTIKGTLYFWGDPASGPTLNFDAYVQLSPEGDFSMIGDDFTKFQINFECLENAARTAQGKGIYTLTDLSGSSSAVASV